jgi:FG-GAP-like repeat
MVTEDALPDNHSSFRGDGKIDLAVADCNANQVLVLLGNGDGTFQRGAAYAVGAQPRSVAVGDFNGDGRADLVTANIADGTISVLLGITRKQPSRPVRHTLPR